MDSLHESLADSARKGVAIGHFNGSDLVGLNAVAAAARRLAMPVLIGTSEGERAFIGIRQAASVVRSIRDEYDVPIFLNADHTHLCRRQSTRLEARSGQCMAETTGADPATPSSKLGAR